MGSSVLHRSKFILHTANITSHAEKGSEEEDDQAERQELSKSLKYFKESREKMRHFMDTVVQLHQQQMTMMNQCLGEMSIFCQFI